MGKNSKKINLMFAIGGLHHGGAERVVATLCNNLDTDRYSITVCWRMGVGAIGEELKAKGIELIGLPELDPSVTPRRRFLVLRKLLKDKCIDIVHTHDTGALVDAAQCRLLGSRSKLVHTYHYGNYPNRQRSHLILEVLFSRMANRLIAVGFEQAKGIQKALYLSSSRLSTIYNGVEMFSSKLREDLVAPYRNKPGNPVVIGSISTLKDEQKGITYLLDTAEILQSRNVNCVFLVAGDGPLRQELEKKCRELNLTDMVYFLGWVPDAGNNLLPSLDIFFQPSLWEANSIVLLEAMASGLAIVTTEVGESRHVIEEGENGWIVQPRDTTAMADVLADLV
ncbi:glycosyltransferase, partial [bacterium]|nr:glycosyltransferase [bacterium]